MADIFISYARADRDRIGKLASALEAQGYSVWWDRHIAGGAEFSKDIESAIRDAKAVIVAWSISAVESHWVRDEAVYARDHGTIIPITIDDTEPPMGFRQVQAIDFDEWTGAKDAPAFKELQRAVALRLEAAPPVQNAGPEGAAVAAAGPAAVVGAGDAVAVSAGSGAHLTDPKVLAGAGLAVLAIILGIVFMLGRDGGGASDDSETVTVAAPTGIADRSKSIAVLPFDDFSADDNEWFADGLTEEILNSLARTPDLLVASRTSSFKYKDTDEEVPVIAERLGVEHVLEGSVRRAGDRLRVTAQLIRADDGFHLWSENYDRDADDVIAIQEEIAIEIAKALETAMDPQALAEMVSAGTRSVEAYEAYLEGRAFSNDASSTAGADSFRNALDAFERATDIDPAFAVAHYNIAGLWRSVYTLTTESAFGDIPAETAYDKAIDHFERAIEAEPDPVRKKKYEAERAFSMSRFREAAAAGEAYVAQFPSDDEARDALARAYVFLADYDSARESARTYESIIGNDEDQLTLAIINYVWSKDYDNAARIARQIVDAGSDNAGLLYQAQRALLWAGDRERAEQALRQYEMAETSSTNRILTEVRQACVSGDRRRAEDIAESLDSDDAAEISRKWLAYKMIGRDEEARALLAPYDRAEPPYLLTGFLYYPYFDASEFPNLQRVLTRERINRPPPANIPFACPPATEQAQKEASIAVLPFADMSAAGDQAWFADGLAEEILNGLAKVQALKVASRTSSFAMRDDARDLRDIAADLDVSHILEGSVRRAGDRLRVTAQLINASDGFHLWSETFDAEMSDVFAVQDDIAKDVVAALSDNLGASPDEIIPTATVDMEAYNAYLKGDHAMRRYGNSQSAADAESAMTEALAHYREALALDPNFAQAHGALAAALFLTVENADDRRAAIGAAIAAAERALEIDGSVGEAHATLGATSFLRGDVFAARRHLSRALALDPNDMTALNWNGVGSFIVGELTEAEGYIRAFARANPDVIWSKERLSGIELALGNFQAALSAANDSMDRQYGAAGSTVAIASWAAGDKASAREGHRQFTEEIGDPDLAAYFETMSAGLEDDAPPPPGAADAPENASATFQRMRHAFWLMTIYDEPEAALALIGKRARTEPIHLINVWMPYAKDVRALPAFKQLMRDMQLVDYWRENGWPDLCRPLNDNDFECD